MTFDHGAQYIKRPKSVAFADLLSKAEKAGYAAQWKGEFATFQTSASTFMQSAGADIQSSAKDDRFVGVPGMSSLPKFFIEDQQGITSYFSTKATAKLQVGSPHMWGIHNADDEKVVEVDWVVTTDVIGLQSVTGTLDTSISEHAGKLISDQKIMEAPVKDVPTVVSMVQLSEALSREKFPYDSVTFEPPKYADDGEPLFDKALEGVVSVLGYISRDSSKPLRAHAEGKENWVIQSNPGFATQLIDELQRSAADAGENLSFHELRMRVNTEGNKRLVDAFCAFVDYHSKSTKTTNLVISTEGFRWGKAFPAIDSTSEAYKTREGVLRDSLPNVPENEAVPCYVNRDMGFAACGDYFDPAFAGRVEGAALSGLSVAENVHSIEQIKAGL
jgi:predicted NAD/FAD-dependent oxidoreductase